uniref:glucuronosyltransferase n=1 Tax=Ditylenchus dipsaci TaxID=166011 RepID=A0A915D9Z3_9BILA
MVNLIDDMGDYQVDFVVANNNPTQTLNIHLNPGVNMIRVPMVNNSALLDFVKYDLENQHREEQPQTTIVHNPEVEFQESEPEHILDWLRNQEYSFGMAEFGHLTSAFAVFHELGIEKTVGISTTPLLPAFYHFLGLQIPVNVPEHFSAQSGDANRNSRVRVGNSSRNLKEYEDTIEKFVKIYDKDYRHYYKWAKITFRLKKMVSLSSLLHNVQYVFVNHHPLTAFPKPFSPKIKFIGGIQLEIRGKYEQKITDYNTMEQLILWNKTDETGIKFSKLIHDSKLHVEDLLQALYAGVPMICIPFIGDQKYNASIVEYLGVGLWNRHPEFGATFPNQLHQLLEANNPYMHRAVEVADAIRSGSSHYRHFNVFRDTINAVVNDDASINTKGFSVKKPRFVANAIPDFQATTEF